MMKNIISLLWLVLVTVPCASFGQFPKLDKARADIYNAKTDEAKLNSLLAIASFKNSMNADSINYYAQWTKKLAIQLKNNKALLSAEQSLLAAEMIRGNTDSVIPKMESNVIFRDVKKVDTTVYYKLQLLKANVLNRQNKRTEALELELKLLDETEKEGNTYSELFVLNYIGATYSNMPNTTREAEKTWLQAIDIINKKDSTRFKEIECYVLSNLAILYLGKFYTTPTNGLSDTCLYYLNRTVDLSRQTEAMGVLASILSYRGNFYGYKKNFAAGEADFKELLEIRKKIGDPLYISEDYKNMAAFYFQTNQYEKCLAIAQEGLQLCNRYNIKETEISLLGLIASVYKTNKAYEKYAATLENIIVLSDSSNRINSADKIAEIQTKYEVQKKETLIAQQKLDLFRRNLLLYGAGIAALLLAAFFIFRFKKYQQRQKIIMEQKRKQNELAVKDAEENERKRIAAELHDNLGVQANAILYNSGLLSIENDNDKHVVTDLQETAKEMLHNLRETLWAMKATDVTVTDLWLRIINFMKQMGRHYSNIDFKVEGLPPENFMIASNQALHIVLVFQESVNNSVKHANATVITAASMHTNAGWQIQLSDNGKGFNLNDAKAKPDSYGLSNMRQRAKEGNFNYHIESAIDKGTTATIRVNI
jgi:two-component system, NarL family, sensor kinase